MNNSNNEMDWAGSIFNQQPVNPINNVGTPQTNSIPQVENKIQPQQVNPTSNVGIAQTNSIPQVENKVQPQSINSTSNVGMAQTNSIPQVENKVQPQSVNSTNNVGIAQTNNIAQVENKIQPQPVNSTSNVGIAQTNSVSQVENKVQPQPVNSTSNVGIAQTNNIPQVENNMNQQTNSSLNTQSDNENLLRAFIGKNYEKITTRVFNFAGFFFTTLYMFYRKMFLYGLIVFILNLIIINVIKNMFVTLAFNIFVGLFVNRIYLMYAKKKIKNIENANPQKSESEKAVLCEVKGGTSVGNVILGLIVEFVIAVVIVIIMSLVGIASIFGSLFKSPMDNYEKNYTVDGPYDGSMSYSTTVKLKDEFDMDVPDDFVEGFMHDEASYKYEYSESEGSTSICSFSFAKVLGYSSASKLANEMSSYYSNSEATPVAVKIVNDINWYHFSFDGMMDMDEMYLMNKGKDVYLLHFEIDDDRLTECNKYKNEVINSINVK